MALEWGERRSESQDSREWGKRRFWNVLAADPWVLVYFGPWIVSKSGDVDLQEPAFVVLRGGKQGRWGGHQWEEEAAVSVQVGCGGQGEPALGGAASRARGTGCLKGSAQKGSRTLGERVKGGLCVSSQFLRDDREG